MANKHDLRCGTYDLAMKITWRALGVGLLLSVALMIWKAKRGISPEAMHREAQQLITKAGGAAEVCSEGNQLFAKFGTSKLTFFMPSEIKDYPAVAALGIVDGIWPSDPPYIKIRVGNHFTGFVIEILDVRQGKLTTKAHNVELIEPCILVSK
jgi:hypothetical protein